MDPTSPSELKQIINALPKKKSPGPDLIPNIVLQQLPPKFLAFLASLYNGCIALGYFPKQWKVAQILLFHKPGKNKNNISSYRPISLLNTFSKLFEKIIYNRLEPKLSDLGVLPAFQFGFRKHHSSTQQLLRITEMIERGYDGKKYTAALFLDVAQAFDKVWIDGLKYKLLLLKLPSYLTAIIFSYLEDRTFFTNINNEISTIKEIRAGVPQGSILGPALFNIYVADIPQTSATLAMFADDTAILTQNHDLNHQRSAVGD